LIKVKVKKLSPEAQIPLYATPGSACVDLVSMEGVYIEPQSTKTISTGLSFEIPEGYKMAIYPRSGISAKTPIRVANSPAVIDCDFRGEVKIILTNTMQLVANKNNVYYDLNGNHFTMSEPEMKKLQLSNVSWGTIKINKGDRVAQAEIVPVLQVEFEETLELSETERGDGGFGSSGI
jgi:dUTP pyrophosphatase